MDTIEHQRGEPFRTVTVIRESTDGGSTWTRISLAGMHYARDIRNRRGEGGTLLLAIRDDDDNAWATLEDHDVQLDDEEEPSTVGVIVVVVPRDAALVLPVGMLPTDEALVDAETGDPLYLVKATVAVSERTTVIEEEGP